MDRWRWKRGHSLQRKSQGHIRKMILPVVGGQGFWVRRAEGAGMGRETSWGGWYRVQESEDCGLEQGFGGGDRKVLEGDSEGLDKTHGAHRAGTTGEFGCLGEGASWRGPGRKLRSAEKNFRAERLSRALEPQTSFGVISTTWDWAGCVCVCVCDFHHMGLSWVCVCVWFPPPATELGCVCV